MPTFSYTDRTWTLVKDALFIFVGLVLIVRTRFWGVLIGAAAVWWYGRDLYYQVKAARKEKKACAPESPAQKQSDPDGKIQVTDLSGAKEVDFEKE
ncbi:MAG: hypothetical protein IJ721_04180 [Bacteroidales bacterium]|nr:hypothetical protein [Bacteroidales bacterium]